MILGAIGVRSKHLRFFQEALSAEGTSITHVCPADAPELAGSLQDMTLWPDPADVVARSDALLLLQREGYSHAHPATLALRTGKPVFVDKPFTCDAGQACALLQLARKTGTPLTGGSTLCFTPEAQQLKEALPHCREYTLRYQADPFYPYGGWYFYGSHLTDLCVFLFGGGFQQVEAQWENACVTARIHYPDFCVTLRTTPQAQPPTLTADRTYYLDDRGCYRSGMRHFLAVIKKETPGCAERLFYSVKLMEAILTALRAPLPAQRLT